MAIYSKEFLVDAYVSRFLKISTIEELLDLEDNAVKLYDKIGKEEFRKYASLDAQTIKEYNNA